MKYAPSIYAQAFLEAKPDAKKFLSIIRKNGDLARIEQIMKAIEELATKKQGGRNIEIEVARDSAPIDKFKFHAKDRIQTKINPTLVAGVRITIDGEQEFDGSLKRKLNKLFV